MGHCGAEWKANCGSKHSEKCTAGCGDADCALQGYARGLLSLSVTESALCTCPNMFYDNVVNGRLIEGEFHFFTVYRRDAFAFYEI